MPSVARILRAIPCRRFTRNMTREEEKAYWARVVRETQKLADLTLQELADRLDLCVREISYMKAGKARPTGMCAVRLYEYRAILFLELERKQA